MLGERGVKTEGVLFGFNFLFARVKCLLHKELNHVTNLFLSVFVFGCHVLSQSEELFAVLGGRSV